MFGSLKKRLKDVVKKVSAIVAKEEQPKEELKEKTITDEVHEEIDQKIEKLEEIRKKIDEEKLPPEIVESRIEQEKILDEERGKKEEDEFKEKEIAEKEELRATEKIKPEIKTKERTGFFPKIFKKVSEKKLTESDIEKILKELQIALLENDTALEVAERICENVKNDLLNKSVKRGKVEEIIKDSLRDAMLAVMSQDKINIKELIDEKDEPYIIMLLGFNGTGKTTTLAKLAKMLKEYKPVVAAADTFRAASIEQIEEHSRRLGFDVVKHKYGADAAAVIFDARKHAAASGSKLVLADTAGRSHANVNLMDELKKVCRVNNPDLKILVLDALTGNDIYDQARLFNDAVGVDAIILTKTDVYEKGGAALSAAYTIKKPILYLGTGQEYEDLKEFVPEKIANMLLE